MKRFLMAFFLVSAVIGYAQYYPTYNPHPYYGGAYYGSSLPNTVFKNINITVVTKGDSTVNFLGTLYAGMDIATVGKNGKQYNPRGTKEIILNSFQGEDRMRGFSTDSTWLFQVIEGKINMYSRVPLKGDKQATAIQKGDGEIVQLNMANLRKMIPEKERDLKLVDLFDQYKLQRIVKYYNKMNSGKY